jgi:hypothetical protein
MMSTRLEIGRLSARRVMLTITAGWSVCLVVTAFVARVLYADGGLFVLTHLLNPYRFNDYDPNRTISSILTQAPILVGQQLGVEDVVTYAALYAMGTSALPAAAFLYSLWVSRNEPVLFCSTAFAIVVFGFGANFINTEANLFFGLAWLASTLLVLRDPRPIERGVVVPALALLLLRTYEGILLIGPLLGAMSYLALRDAHSRLERIGLSLALLLFILGTASGFAAFLSPRDPGNVTNFLASLPIYLRNPQFLLLLSALSMLAVVIAPGVGRRAQLIFLGWLLAILFVLSINMVNGYYGYTIYYQNRAFLIVLLPFCIALVGAARFYMPASSPPTRPHYALMLIPFAAAAYGDMLGSYRWDRYITAFCEVLKDRSSPAEGVDRLKRTGAVTGWSWTHPTMSVLLRERGSDAMVLNEPGQRWEPFDPSRAVSIAYRGVCEDRKGRVGRD